MWRPDGPSQYWTRTKGSTTPLRYEADGFVGHYVCQVCQQPVTGVYRISTGKNVGNGFVRDMLTLDCEE